MHLPKGTELYISDIHGEFTAFDHILRTGAGNIKEKISLLFGDRLTEHEKDKLTILVAYPREALDDKRVLCVSRSLLVSKKNPSAIRTAGLLFDQVYALKSKKGTS